MRTASQALALLVLVLALVAPAGAQVAPELHGPCTGDNVFHADDDLSEVVDTPLLPGDVTTVTYKLSLEGRPVTERSATTVGIDWGDVTDFDLTANGAESASFNPTDGEGESVTIGSRPHCSTITVDITNFAGNPLATMVLDITAL